MTITPERAKDPTPEASAAADECATEDGPGGPHFVMPAYQRRRVALALDAFAREAVEKAMREAILAWMVCASIHRQYAKGKDPFYSTRQADFVKHEADCREGKLRNER